MGENNTNNNPHSIADYLAQLLKDRKQLGAFPNVFLHVERLLDEEIGKVRGNLFQISETKKEPLSLPEPEGPTVTLSEKVYVPVKEHPDFNFVGRILGPRGMTAKQLEQETGCKIMVRGRGSMRDKKKEEQNRGKPNWEHLQDELHVLLTVEDTEIRAKMKLQRAVEEIKRLLVPSADGEDELKKRQLMELAIINGTYRDSTTKNAAGDLWCNHIAASLQATLKNCQQEDFHEFRPMSLADLPRLMSAGLTSQQAQQLRPQAPLGAPLILSPRLQTMQTHTSASLSAAQNHLMAQGASPHDTASLMFAPYSDAYTTYAALTSPLFAEYNAAAAAAATADHTGGLFAR
jgi:protein quaking